MSMIERFMQDILGAGAQTVGFHPVQGPSDARFSLGMGAARFDFVPGRVSGRPAQWTAPSNLAMPAGLGLGLSALGYAGIAASEGPGAAASLLAFELGSSQALTRYHYNARGIAKPPEGALLRPGAIGAALSGEVITRAKVMNTVAYFGKYALGGGAGALAGSTVGGAVGGAVGGQVGRTVGEIGGGYAGAYAGVAGLSAIASSGPMGWGAAALIGVGILGATTLAAAPVAAGYGTYQVLRAGYRHQQMRKSIHTSGSLAAFSTQGAHTMRARAVQAIHKSHLNARSALGQEANFMHFPSRNYHSRYRRAY